MSKSEMPNVIRLFLIDDEALVRAAIESIINSWEGFQIVGEAPVDTAIEQLHRVSCDVVLLSLAGTDDVDGLIAKAVARNCRNSPLVVLVGACDENFRKRLLRFGANRVVLKTEHPNELRSVIQTLRDTLEPERRLIG